MAKTSPAIEAIRAWIANPNKQLTPEQELIRLRLERVHWLYFDARSAVRYDSDAVLTQHMETERAQAGQSKFSKAQARLDLMNAQDLYALVPPDGAARGLVLSWHEAAFVIAFREKDHKGMVRAADAYRLAHGFDKRDGMLSPQERQVPTLYLESPETQAFQAVLLALAQASSGSLDVSKILELTQTKEGVWAAPDRP
jgi:hypothetical protein